MMERPEARLNEWADYCGKGMEEKGFHTDSPLTRESALVRLCLVHTEVSEASQVVKKKGINDPKIVNADLSEEIADALIRIFDLCYLLNIDIDSATAAKMRKNMARPHKYGTPQEGQICTDGTMRTSVESADTQPSPSRPLLGGSRQPFLAWLLAAMGLRRTNTSRGDFATTSQNMSGMPTTSTTHNRP